jgi:3-hydroxyisobutyrate dehydrogenase
MSPPPGALPDSPTIVDGDHPIAPGTTRVGFIGLGVMGASMCGHLIAKGYEVTVSTRTPARATPLLERGARWARTPAEVAATSDVVLTMVGLPADVRDVYFGEQGLFSAARPGQRFVDHTTSSPALAVELARAAQGRGVVTVDAPVSGGDIGAREARLSIMCGGEAAVVEELRPLLSVYGRTLVHQGPPGAGQHAKIVNQTLIASCMVGVCEALLYGYAAGLDLERVLESVAMGAAGSFSLTAYAPRILNGDFEPGFFVEHLLKDLEIALGEARRLGLVLPGLELAERLYRSVAAHGWQRRGTQALILALAELSQKPWPPRP